MKLSWVLSLAAISLAHAHRVAASDPSLAVDTAASASALAPFGLGSRPRHASKGEIAAFNTNLVATAFAADSSSDSSEWVVAAAVAFAASKGISATVTGITHTTDLSLAHVFLVQTVNGVEIENAVANANLDLRTHSLVSFASSFVEPYASTSSRLMHAGTNPFSLPRLHKAAGSDEYVGELGSVLRSDPDTELWEPLEALDFLFEELGIGRVSGFASVAPFERHARQKRESDDDSSDNDDSSALLNRRHFRVAPDVEIFLDTIPFSAAPFGKRDGGEEPTKLSIPGTLKYYHIAETASVIPVWDFEVDLGNHWFHAHVDARKISHGEGQRQQKTVGLIDWVSPGFHENSNSDTVFEVTPVPKSQTKRQRRKKAKKNKSKLRPFSASETSSLSIGGIYNVFPLGTNDPFDGDRNLVVGPLSLLASPNGWHWCSGGKQQCPDGNYTVTIGNNVFAQENLSGGYNDWMNKTRPDGGSKLFFDMPVDLQNNPETYTDAAVVNLFYWNNALHDLFYVYGFTEETGNFQDSNIGRGGLGGDSVIANAQDGSGFNNANFATPPDGTHGRMRMYVWNVVEPWRDGDLEGGIIMHEYAHGVSIRLTGGPANSGCLGFGEAGGMGEGWGDFFATITRMTANNTRNDIFGMGEYSNGGKGIRKFSYSTNMTTNPSTYSYITKPGYWGVHPKGEVWAAILYDVFWNIVDAHGFNVDWFDTPMTHQDAHMSGEYREFSSGRVRARKGTSVIVNHETALPESDRYPLGGNVLMLQLVVDGLKNQPCMPSFVDARDAILLAEKYRTGSKNKCLLWKGFAKRGLGFSAADGGTDGFDLPDECSN
ncbi:Fungalysin/Thermolysin Extracellular metalloproteinase 5 [Entophlyctis luteolus]|nr:Fungalysin/Thermolysin Extracellular metalloproteinase 5 [Entophlyctis luteolus]